MHHTRHAVAAALGTLALCATLAAQEPEPGPAPPVGPPLPGAPQSEDREMIELFAEVERNLVAIDDLLFEAAAAEGELLPEDAGLDRLLDRTQERSRAAIEGIERILELSRQRQQQQQQQSQAGQGSGQPQGGDPEHSPLDGRDPGPPREAERGAQGNDPSTDPGRGDQPSQPDSPEESDDEGEEREGPLPPDGGRGPGSDAVGSDRWGELPPRVQQLFRNQISDDMPVQYRDWIDGYHRRLNRTP